MYISKIIAFIFASRDALQRRREISRKEKDKIKRSISLVGISLPPRFLQTNSWKKNLTQINRHAKQKNNPTPTVNKVKTGIYLRNRLVAFRFVAIKVIIFIYDTHKNKLAFKIIILTVLFNFTCKKKKNIYIHIYLILFVFRQQVNYRKKISIDCF